MCDEEIDNFCCRFTTISLVMERNGGCRIASPAWQTNSLVARQQHSQATVNKVLPLVTDSPAFLTISDHLRFANFYHQCHHTSTGLGVRWDAHFFSTITHCCYDQRPSNCISAILFESYSWYDVGKICFLQYTAGSYVWIVCLCADAKFVLFWIQLLIPQWNKSITAMVLWFQDKTSSNVLAYYAYFAVWLLSPTEIYGSEVKSWKLPFWHYFCQ